MSPVTWAIAPLEAAAIAWPEAQARLARPKPRPWWSFWRSAPSLIIAEAGTNKVPKEGNPKTTSPTRTAAGRTMGSSTLTHMAAASDSLTGSVRPRRSDRRPTSGAKTASSPAAPRKAPAITTAPAPRELSLSGVRTSIAPKETPARNVSHIPPETPRSRNALAALRSCWEAASTGVATRKLATARQSPAKVARAKAGAVPTALAKAPRIGPTRAPATATPSAAPMAWPRRSGGVPAASQAIAPDQMQAPPRPWARRAESSRTIELPKPNTKVAPLMRQSPRTTAFRTPRRVARTPPGNAPTRVPNG